MNGVIFTHTLRMGWRNMLYWGVGLGVYAFYACVIIPSVELLQQYTAIVETLPPIMLQMLGMGSDLTFLGTPEGFISFGYFSYVVIMLAIYAVLAGLNVTANEEDQGILDVLLSLPLPRWRLIVEKAAAYALLSAGIVALSTVGIVAGTQLSALKVDMVKLISASVNILPSTLLVLAFTICAAGFIRRRGTAAGVAALFVTVSYFLNVIAVAGKGSIAESLGRLSFMFYYDNNGVIQNGLSVVNVGALLAVSVLLLAGGIWAFQRRDVGV